MYKKRGQVATEYLIILAVVVIIALIVVVILGAFPGIGRGTSAKASAAYWANTAPVGITSYEISDTATSNSIIMRNNGVNPITITSITFDTTVDNVADTTFTAGEEKTVALTTLTCTAGETYEYTVAITYNNDKTGETGLIFSGDVDLVGECLDI